VESTLISVLEAAASRGERIVLGLELPVSSSLEAPANFRTTTAALT
jgi:hypothetical protein